MPKKDEPQEEEPDMDRVDYAVEQLCVSTPEQRPAEAAKIRLIMQETGGVTMVWNQLCRQRKPDGAQAGLKVLVGMLQEPKKDGHEPAIVILATLCNERQYATAIAKTYPQAFQVLRRTSEFSRNARTELGTNRDALQLIARIMRFEDLSLPPPKARGGMGRTESGASSASSVQRTSSSMSRTAPSPLAPSRGKANAANSPAPAKAPFAQPSTKAGGVALPPLEESKQVITRPVTSMTTFGNTHVLTYENEPDSMCVEGNVCAAIGNACHQDEVLDRLGKTAGLLDGLINLLQYGSDWARGHACRSLGNVCALLDNCKQLAQADASNTAPKTLAALLEDADCSRRTRLWALHAVCNLSRSTALCATLGRLDVQSTLLTLGEHGFPEEDVERAVANMCQVRLGTRTWRAAKKI